MREYSEVVLLREKEDYPERAIAGMLLNWRDMEEVRGENGLISKWDMEMAFRLLSAGEYEIVNTARLMGSIALKSRAIKGYEWGALIKKLHRILNIEGMAETKQEEYTC